MLDYILYCLFVTFEVLGAVVFALNIYTVATQDKRYKHSNKLDPITIAWIVINIVYIMSKIIKR